MVCLAVVAAVVEPSSLVLQVLRNLIQKSLGIILNVYPNVVEVPLEFPHFRDFESNPFPFSSYSEVRAPELKQLGTCTYTFKAGYQNLSSATMNEEFGLLNSTNTPEAQYSNFNSSSLKVA